MRKILIGFAAATIVACSGVSMAQDGGPPSFAPVEMQACTYKDRQDRDDLDGAMDKMTQWMEDEDGLPYSAWILSKLYTGPDREFDFLYVGAWPDGSTILWQATAAAVTKQEKLSPRPLPGPRPSSDPERSTGGTGSGCWRRRCE